MNLPKADAVEIAKEKITDYLLNPLHPDGASKAAFFAALAFKAEKWEELANALRLLAGGCPVAKTADTVHGTKYVVDGPLATPVGKSPVVRTVWIVDQGADTP
ncbi:MAG: hypothetical protein HYU36_23005 [Planctomycetes bacterium]|nr:hypothetical protein [Planctomycetota bacterium]